MPESTYERRADLPACCEEAFAWHERPGALERLTPPWENVRVVRRGASIQPGEQVVLQLRVGPFARRWVAQHREYQPPHRFSDVQVRGPFARWEHEHLFTRLPDGRCRLTDRVRYRLPGGPIAERLLGNWVARKIDRMFQYRHRVTIDDLMLHQQYRNQGMLHVAVTGSHGLVGSSLVALLEGGGHRVTRLVRGQAAEGEIAWDPLAGQLDPGALAGVDAVVHLAGENIASGRWTAERKQRILESRVAGTQTISRAMAAAEPRPRVLVSASAIGYYGDRGDELLDETSPPGDGFLADVVQQWEAATGPAAEAGIRVVPLRFGMILSPRGGALAKMLTPFRLGAGGVVGSGRQYWSWITLDDATGAILHALMHDELSGPTNAVSPNPVTNREFTRLLGRVLRRPTVFPMPAFAARLALGEMADELLLASARVVPKKLLDSGYSFRHPQLEPALRHLLGR